MSRFDGSRGPPRIEGMTSLKVDNLTYRTTIEELDRYFTKFGDVGDIYIPRDRHRRESRGFAFVRYYERRDAEDAMDAMDGAVIDGREIRVQLAKYGRPTEQYVPPRDRGRSRYGGGRYGGRDRSPGRRRRRSRSRSQSRRRSRSRSRSGSPRRYTRRYSRSPRKYSRSRSPRRSRSASRSPRRSRSDSRSRSPVRSRSPTKSRSRSRSAGSPKRSRSGSRPRSKSPPVMEEREENHSMEGEDEE